MVRTLCNVRFAAADSRGNSDEKSASQRIVAARATRTPTKRSEMVVIGRALARIVIGLKSKPKVTEADLAAASKTATSANALVRIGDRYYALGQYSKAVDTYRLAMAKPGADANLANLHLGMALARSGDKAGAAAALNKVSGPHAEIAKYWLVYTQTHA